MLLVHRFLCNLIWAGSSEHSCVSSPFLIYPSAIIFISPFAIQHFTSYSLSSIVYFICSDQSLQYLVSTRPANVEHFRQRKPEFLLHKILMVRKINFIISENLFHKIFHKQKMKSKYLLFNFF